MLKGLLRKQRLDRRKKKVASKRYDKELFRVDSLEPRVLLYGDPVIALASQSITMQSSNQPITSIPPVSVQNQAQQLSTSAQSSATTFALDTTGLQNNGSAIYATVATAAQQATTDRSFRAIVTAPAVNNAPSLTQTAADTLQIQLGGYTPGVNYDQINITGNSALAGTLSISLANGFVPVPGDVFNILNSATISGSFSSSAGLYGFGPDYYFEVVQTATGVQLVTKELVSTSNFNLTSADPLVNNQLGTLLNLGYFATSPTSVALTGTLQFADSFYLSGAFTFSQQSALSTISLSDGTTVGATSWTVAARGVNAFLGVNGLSSLGNDFGLSLNGVNLGLAFFNPVAVGDARSWLITQGTVGSASLLNLGSMNLTASMFSLDASIGMGLDALGAANTSVVNLSATPLTISDSTGQLALLNDNGALGQRIQISGTASMTISTFSVSGNFAFSKNNLSFDAIGQNVSAQLSAGGITVGIDGGSFGVSATSTALVMEASGNLVLIGGGFELPSATSVAVRINQTGIDYTGQQLVIANQTYTFGSVTASTSLEEVSITGLQAGISGLFSVSGDFGFRKNGLIDETLIVANNATVMLGSGSFQAGVTSASLGMVAGLNGRALEASGSIIAQLGTDVSLSATAATVRWNETGTAYLGQTISTAALSYTFQGLDAAASREVQLTGASLNVAGFFQASGSFAIQQSTQQVTLSDASVVNVDTLSIGATAVAVFAGLNGGSANALGVSLTGADFALLMMSDKANASRKWTSLQTLGGTASFAGFAGLAVSANSLTVNINRADNAGLVVDYTAMPVTVATGVATTMTLNMAGAQGALLQASGNLTIDAFGFFAVSGGFAIEKLTQSVMLSDGSQINTDLLTIGTSGVTAFAGLNGGTADQVGVSLSGVNFALAMVADQADSARKWVSLQATAAGAAFAGISGLTLSATSISVEINRADAAGLVVDYAAMPLVVNTGPGSTITLNMDGVNGPLIRASGNLNINLFNFFALSGGFAFEKTTQLVTLSDGTTAMTDMLRMGGANVTAFAGLNGGTVDQFGVSLSGVNFALVLMADQANSARKWASLQATAATASFVGVTGITLSANTLSVEINQVDAVSGLLVDYAAMPLTVTTGPGSSMVLNMAGADGALIRASGNLDINLFNFFSLSGGFSFEKSTQAITLSDGSAVTTDMLSMGGSGITAFAGLNGGSADALGLSLGSVDFALVMLADQVNNARKWVSLQASAGSAAFMGLPGVSLSGDTLSVSINQPDAVNGLLVDYLATPLVIATGPASTITMNMAGADGALIRASGNLSINLYNFFSLSGGFAFEKSIQTVTLSDASTVTTDMLTIGASGVVAFAGMNGGSADALGLSLVGVDFALVMMTDQVNSARKWSSLQAVAASASFVGMSGITLAGKTMSVSINRADAVGTLLVDYAAMPLVVATGPGSSITMNMAGADGELLRTSGTLDINLYNFFSLSGGFALEKVTQVVTLSDGSSATTDMMTLGGSNVTAFAGMNGGTADAFGLNLTGVNFGLALMTDQANTARKWMSLQATATSASFTGITGLTVAADTISVVINNPDATGLVVDYLAMTNAGTPFSVLTGPLSTMAFNMDGQRGQLLQASANLNVDMFGFFSVSGGFALEKSTQLVTLSDGTTVNTDMMTIGASGVNAFAGLNGGTLDQLGLSLGNIDFALALMSEKGNTAHKWTALKTTGGTASLVGINGLVVSANTLQVVINKGYTPPTATPVTTVTNTTMKLGLYANTVGTLTFSYQGVTSAVVINRGDSDAAIALKVRTAIEGLAGIGAGNVLVTGDRATGFVIEFTGALAGINVTGLTVSTIAGAATATITRLSTGAAAINEGQLLAFQTPKQAAPAVSTSVQELAPWTAGSNEIQIITIAGLSTATGMYTLSYGGITSAPIRFAQSDVTTNKNRISDALRAMAPIGTNVYVTFDQMSTVSNQRYFVTFTGGLAKQNVSAIVATATTLPSTVTATPFQTGAAGHGQIQNVTINTAATGTFQLTLNHQGLTYTTAALAFTATAAQVQTALNTALTGLAGASVTVAAGTTGWDITFGGTVSKQTMELLTVQTRADTAVAGGTFTLGFGAATTAAINYAVGSTAQAALIQTALEGLAGIGVGNVQVSYDANSTKVDQFYKVSFIGALAGQDVQQITVNGAALSFATATTSTQTQGVAGGGEVQKVVLNSASDTGTFTLSLLHLGTTYSTAAIAFDATQQQIQTAVDAAFAGLAGAAATVTFWNQKDLQITFGGTLAGQALNLMTSTITPVATSATLTAATVGSTVTSNPPAAGAIVVDFAAMPLVVTTGPLGTTMTLDMAGSQGELLKASGNLTIDASGFFQVSGGFAMEKFTQNVSLINA
ncbi:MAG: hypothetical protein COZ00_03575, partial [Zetaproteobacteria bacterium CG_4_10_14_0_8_um_filter_49_80]